jgi:hypothetical protein
VQAELKDTLQSVRRLSADGEFGTARKRLDSAVPQAEPGMRNLLHNQALTLEVLEGVDVVRRLLLQGKTASAAKAATRISTALGKPDYARLEVSNAAQSLLGRAEGLASRIDGGDRTARTREELDAFLEHMGAELERLQGENVDRSLEAAMDSRRSPSGASTLGDLLNRRPWRSGLSRAVQPAPQTSGRRLETTGEAPRRAGVSVARPAEQAEPGDLFELMSRAALEYWHIILFAALVFAIAGYFGVVATMDRYESVAQLQTKHLGPARAPVSKRPQDYVQPVASKIALNWTTLQEFHSDLSDRTRQSGDTIPPEVTRAALTAKADETGDKTYRIALTAIHRDPEWARAIAAAAADELRERFIEHQTNPLDAILLDREKRRDQATAELDAIRKKRLEELKLDDVEAVGKAPKEWAQVLTRRLENAQADLNAATLELRSAEKKLAAQMAIRDQLPEFDEPVRDARIEERVKSLTVMERDLRNLKRKAEPFGPDHPDQKVITELQEEIELLRAEIQEMEKEARDPNRPPPLNRERALAEDRVATDQFRVNLMQDKVSNLTERIPRIEEQLQQLKPILEASPEQDKGEAELLKELAKHEDTIQDVTAMRASADREIELLSPASKPAAVKKDVLVGTFVGVVLGAIVGLAGAVWLFKRRS